MNRVNLLSRLDNYLKDKKDSEISLIFFMIFAIVAFFVYMYIFPFAEKNLKKAQKEYKSIEAKLIQEKTFLNSVSKNGDRNYILKKIKTDLDKDKSKLKQITFENSYVDKKLKDLSYVLFNDKNWAKFLDSITLLAKHYNIDLKLIENQFLEPNLQQIKEVLTLKVIFSGNFKSILKFINSLEESKLVVDIKKINLNSDSIINGELDIAVWGMKY